MPWGLLPHRQRQRLCRGPQTLHRQEHQPQLRLQLERPTQLTLVGAQACTSLSRLLCKGVLHLQAVL